MRLVTYNDIINLYTINNKYDKYNNYNINSNNKTQQFIFNNAEDVRSFIRYYKFKNHTFGDLSLGDEIIINDGKYNKPWLIAGFNTQLDSDVKLGSLGVEHIVLIPKSYLRSRIRMDGNNTNVYGFANTEMFNKTLSVVNNNLENVLHEYLLPHEIKLSINNHTQVKSFIAKSMLLSYYQAFGRDVPYRCYCAIDDAYKNCKKGYRMFEYTSVNGDFDNGDDLYQLPLFNFDVKYRTVQRWWWLRNTFSVNYFSSVSADYGFSTEFQASAVYNCYVLRPFICIGKKST